MRKQKDDKLYLYENLSGNEHILFTNYKPKMIEYFCFIIMILSVGRSDGLVIIKIFGC